ncbi:MAG: hypothetical protein JXB19_06880 [Bacteroidales bacterium]|nr:hypothetical protein [Bacteroidales bacterium]
MTKKVLLLFPLLLLIACDKEDISSLQADSFIKFYNTRAVFTSADVKQMSNDGYAVLGTVETLTSGTQICLLRTDEYGNSVDSAKFYGRSLNDRAYCLQVLPDGFAILGSSQNPLNSNLEVYFIRTDRLGEILWTRTIGGLEDMEAYHFEIDTDGSYIMTGYAKRSGSTNDKQIWLFAIDRDGNDRDDWPTQRTYGGDRDEEGVHLQIMDDGKIAITGNTKSYPLGTLTRHSYILIANNIGGLVTFLTIDSPADEDANCIRVLDDGNFLIIGTMRSNLTGQGSDIILRKITLSPTVPDEVIWSKWYGTSGDDTGKSIIVDGSNYVLLGTTAATGGLSSISLIMTDPDGENPEYAHFGQGTQLTGTSFAKTSDSGFIISGTNKHTDTHVSVALIKTRPDVTL